MAMKTDGKREEGISSVGVLVALLIVVTLGLGGFGVYSYSHYRDQKDNTDAKINTAVTAAKKQQTADDNKVFAEEVKQPNTTFNGPTDLGSVKFGFPKTWSVYLGNGTGGDGTFTAYMNPVSVPTISSSQQYALRLTIEPRDYETILNSYASLVKKGTLKSSIVTTNGLSGTRLDGAFTKDLNGAAVIFKIRDKTLTIQTDSPTYLNDFNTSVVPSLTFTE